MKISRVLQQGMGAVCLAVQSATQESRGSEDSLPHGVITEVKLSLEREAGLKGDQEGRVFQEKDQQPQERGIKHSAQGTASGLC